MKYAIVLFLIITLCGILRARRKTEKERNHRSVIFTDSDQDNPTEGFMCIRNADGTTTPGFASKDDQANCFKHTQEAESITRNRIHPHYSKNEQHQKEWE